MNRENKFRAYSLQFSKFLKPYEYPNGHDDLLLDITTGLLTLQDDENQKEYYQDLIFEQYIGLRDKNGKEIYAGDIIYCNDLNEKVRGIIVEDVERTGFKIEWITKTDFNEYIHVRIDKIQIIGNIHENPELI